MAILRAGGGGRPRLPRTLPIVQNPTPRIGGNYSREAVARASQRLSAPAPSRPQPVVSQPVRRPAPRPSPAPKPPPVVVPNNQGHYTRPAPPPTVRPGAITGGGGGNRGNNNRQPNPPRRNVPVPTPSNPAQQIAPAAPQVPVPPGLDEYLAGDTGYQGQLGQFGSQFAQFQAGQQGTRNQNAASFAQRLRDLQQAQTLDESDLQEDFASRGLSNSGVYGSALGDLQQQYLTSQSNLQTEQTNSESDLAAQLAEFQAQQAAAQQQAYMDAIARRAAQYGLV